MGDAASNNQLMIAPVETQGKESPFLVTIHCFLVKLVIQISRRSFVPISFPTNLCDLFNCRTKQFFDIPGNLLHKLLEAVLEGLPQKQNCLADR
jgi:hypothetical protein